MKHFVEVLQAYFLLILLQIIQIRNTNNISTKLSQIVLTIGSHFKGEAQSWGIQRSRILQKRIKIIMHDPVKKRESNNDETNSGELWSFCIILSCGHELVLTITFHKKFSPSRLRLQGFWELGQFKNLANSDGCFHSTFSDYVISARPNPNSESLNFCNWFKIWTYTSNNILKLLLNLDCSQISHPDGYHMFTISITSIR